jgi:hypothetical protein
MIHRHLHKQDLNTITINITSPKNLHLREQQYHKWISYWCCIAGAEAVPVAFQK